MNKISLLCFFTLLTGFSARAAIYGADDRRDIYQVPQYQSVAKAVAVAVGHNMLIKNDDGTRRVDMVDRLGDFVCKDERFTDQPSLGVCTGFLIGDRYLVTAGHCALPTGIVDNQYHPFCEAFDWYFGYNISKNGGIAGDQKIPDDQLYRCKRIIRAETIEHIDPNDETSAPGNDFALIELDRPVVNAIQPLPIAKSAVQNGDVVYTIGHPTGLPAKFSGLSRILKNDNPRYFEANLDTEGGNSGGPVFNAKNEIVGILVSGHPVDYTTDAKLNCDRPNICDAAGNNCREESPFPGLQKSNYIQRIETVLNYLPK